MKNFEGLGEKCAPKVVKKPQLRQKDDGNRLIFECELSGHPQPEATWFCQDQKLVKMIKSGPKYRGLESFFNVGGQDQK